jgi:hypothetical protein
MSSQVYLVLLVSGNARTILQHCGLADTTEIVEIKVEEKIVASLAQVRKIIHERPYDGIIWGCRDVRFQRFQPFMKFHLFGSSSQGFIADEQGVIIRYRLLTFLGKDVPLLLYEALLTLFVIGFSYIKLPLLRRQIRNSSSKAK